MVLSICLSICQPTVFSIKVWYGFVSAEMSAGVSAEVSTEVSKKCSAEICFCEQIVGKQIPILKRKQ